MTFCMITLAIFTAASAVRQYRGLRRMAEAERAAAREAEAKFRAWQNS